MANGTNGIARGLVLLAACLGLTACQSAGIIGPAPENRVGSGVTMTANEPQSASRMEAEPDYIPRTDELVGFREAETEELFGEPSLRRVDRDAQIWQYGADDCVLFLFFYPDDTDTARISYVTSTGAHAGDDGPGDQACVEAVTRDAANAAGAAG